MALTLQAGVDEAIRAHGVETYPERVLRRAVSAATAS